MSDCITSNIIINDYTSELNKVKFINRIKKNNIINCESNDCNKIAINKCCLNKKCYCWYHSFLLTTSISTD